MTRVLLTVRPHGAGANPYITIFAEALPPSVDLRWFSWRRALFSAYDVVHIQWPEYLFRGSTTPRALVRFVLGALLLVRWTLRRTPLIYTVHNQQAHETARAGERFLTRMLLRRVDVRVYLNEAETNDLDEGVVILHQRYPDAPALSPAEKGGPTALSFGLLRPYKGLEDLIDVWGGLDGERVLRVVGPAENEAYAQMLQQRAGGRRDVSVEVGYLPDVELDGLVRDAGLVILPYKRMYNSGAVIKALGLGARVLIPRDAATIALQREVGEDWVTLFESPITADVVRDFCHAPTPSRGPDLTRRDPEAVGRLYARLYDVVATEAQPRGARTAAVLATLHGDAAFRAHAGQSSTAHGVDGAKGHVDVR